MTTGFDFADIFDDVVDRSGGEGSTAADVDRVRRGLRLLLERWEAQGFNTWRIRTLTVQSSGLTPIVKLPDCVDDVLNVSTTRHDSTVSIRRITATEYAQLANKDSDGQPAQYWLDRRADGPLLHIYPIGAALLSVTHVERPAAYDRFGGNEEDVPGRWLEAMIVGLAHDLARKRPPYNEQLIARLKGEAAEAEDIAQRADRDRSRFRYRMQGRRR